MSTKKSLTVERVFDAPVAEVWAAWTDPEQYRRWYHPVPGMELVIHAFDLRVGGRIHFDMPMPDGDGGHATDGIFHVVEPMKRLVFGAKDKSSLNDISFFPDKHGTRLVIVWTSDAPEMASPEMQEMARGAWESSASRLDRLLAA